MVSKATAKDHGDRMEVTAFVYDGIGAAEKEREAFRQKRMGVKPGEAGQGQGGGNKRGPAGRRRVVGAGGAANGPVAGGASGFRRAPVGAGLANRFRNTGRSGGGGPSARGPPPSTSMRRVPGIGRSSAPAGSDAPQT